MHPGDTLSQRVVRSGFWVMFSKIVERLLRFISSIIVARLLSPADFGLFGLACLALNILQTFTEPGINAALVQRQGRIEEYLNTAWTVSLIRKSAIFLILFIFSPLVAQFFNNPEASGVTKAVAFTVLLGGLSNIGVVYFTKDIDFRKQIVLNVSMILSSTMVTIILAYMLRNSWALVWGMLAGSLTNAIMTFVIHPYRPKFHLEWEKAKELFKFGRWVFGSSIIVFLLSQGDDIFVGKFLGTTMLGLYTMAFAIANIAATEISHTVSSIAFPMYAKAQEDKKLLKETFFRTLLITSFISLPVAGLIFSLSPLFTKLLLKEQWMPMVPVLQILTIGGGMRAIGACIGCLLQGVGKPSINTKVMFLQLIVVASLIYPASKIWGIEGVAAVVVFPGLLISGFSYVYAFRYVEFGLKEIINAFLIPLFSTLVMTIVLITVNKHVMYESLAMLVLLSLLGIAIYFFVSLLLNRDSLKTFKLIKNNM